MSALPDLIVFLQGSGDQTAFYSRFHQTRGGSGGSSYSIVSRESRGHFRLTTQGKRHIAALPTPAREGGQRQTEKEIKYLLTSTHESGSKQRTKQKGKEIPVSATSSVHTGLPFSRQSQHHSQGVQSPSL